MIEYVSGGILSSEAEALVNTIHHHREVPKTMYFLQEAGEPLRLRYNVAPPGAYAENLRHVLHAIEGHLIAGYDDGGDGPDKPLTLVPGAVEDAAAFIADHLETRERFDRVAALVDGFESPFGLELLSAVHWVMRHDPVRTLPEVVARTRAWSEREHIALVDRLRALPAETEWVEFKRNRYEPQVLGQYLSALANSACLAGQPRAYLVFGIDDPTHAVVGTRFDPYSTNGKGNQDLLPWLAAGVRPNTGFEVHVVVHPNGRVVLFEIGPARGEPVSFYGTSYVRVGSSKTELRNHPEKARALWTRGSDWSAEVCALATAADLDPAAVAEFPDRVLVTNVGDFLPGDVETVIRQDAPQAIYRNPFLADAMVELNLIDTQGSGIKRMFETQRRRSFPMPDYDLDKPNEVAVSLTGRILDERYTRLLMERADIDLLQVMLLDRVQKGQSVGPEEHRRLKAAGLVEGRYPNLIVAGLVAKATGDAGRHIRERGFDKQYYLDLTLALVRQHGPVTRKDVDQLLVPKLPDRLTEEQKGRKVHNLLQELRRTGRIHNSGTRAQPAWCIQESSDV